MKFIFILFLSFFNYFSASGYLKAAEKINIQFEEMTIPIEIDQLSKLVEDNEYSTELIAWFKENGFEKIFQLSKYLEFPVFKEQGFTKQIMRSWIGKRVLSELSKTIIVPNDKNGAQFFKTIENLLETNSEVSTLDILKALPNQEIILDVDNLILIISSWKKKLADQQNLVSKLNQLEKIDNKFTYKPREIVKTDNKPFQIKLNVAHRDKPLFIEFWGSKNKNTDKDLIVFMPGLGGDITNFRWIGSELSKIGWPIIFINHAGSNSDTLKAVIQGEAALPEGDDFYISRIKDLNAVIIAQRKGLFGNKNDGYILMGHSLGSLISFLYEGNPPKEGFDKRCDKALRDFALTNLSKLIQCQLSGITLPEIKKSNNLKAIIGFNSFGSLIWPLPRSSGIIVPVLLIGGTYDLITPLIDEQFKIFASTSPNSLNRFLLVEGASHFSPIRIKDKNFQIFEDDDVFKINKNFIGHYPNDVQNLALEIIIKFLNDLNKNEGIKLVKRQKLFNLNFHILDNEGIKEFYEN